MNDMIFQALVKALEEHGRATLVTVVEVFGSAPREVGARMVVRVDGTIVGTIGGGALEWETIAVAKTLMASEVKEPLLHTEKSLGPDLGQCCGGRVALMFELHTAADLAELRSLLEAERVGPFETTGFVNPERRYHRTVTRTMSFDDLASADRARPRWRQNSDGSISEIFGVSRTTVLLFGAGHVARAVVMALAPLPFVTAWFDGRTDAFPKFGLPGVVYVSANGLGQSAKAAIGSIILIMTHSHDLDLALAAEALKRDDLALVGVIGSETKRARFVSRLRQAGFDKPALGRLVCPIGVPGIAGKEPAVIAAGVAAQCLQARSAFLARRTVELGEVA